MSQPPIASIIPVAYMFYEPLYQLQVRGKCFQLCFVAYVYFFPHSSGTFLSQTLINILGLRRPSHNIHKMYQCFYISTIWELQLPCVSICNIADEQFSFDLPPLFPPRSIFKQCTMCLRLGLELPAWPTPGHWRSLARGGKWMSHEVLA